MSNIFSQCDNKKFQETFVNISGSTAMFLDLADKLVKEYTADFDDLMKDFYQDAVKTDADDKSLEKYLFELHNILYFLGEKLEVVGIKEDLSRIATKEMYNSAYLQSREKDVDRRNKTTVAELTAMAEDASQYENVVNLLYSRVYKLLKAKIDSGYETVNSIRKIISKRMQDQSLASFRGV